MDVARIPDPRTRKQEAVAIRMLFESGLHLFICLAMYPAR